MWILLIIHLASGQMTQIEFTPTVMDDGLFRCVAARQKILATDDTAHEIETFRNPKTHNSVDAICIRVRQDF